MSWVDDFDAGHDAMPEEPTLRGYGDAAFDAPAEDARGYKVTPNCAVCGRSQWSAGHANCAGAWARRLLEGLR